MQNAECIMYGERGRQGAVPTECGMNGETRTAGCRPYELLPVTYYLLLITCYLLLVTYYLSLVPCFSLALALLRPDSSTARTTEKTLAELPVRDGSTPYRAYSIIAR